MQQQTIETLRQALQESALPFAQQEPLASHTTFQTGGPAVFWCTPKNADQLRRTLALCRANGVRTYLLGNGSNTLFADEGYDGAVIDLRGLNFGPTAEPQPDGSTRLTASAGLTLGRLCAAAQQQGLAGLAFACGIPGTVGGAAIMNAGAYDGEFKDVAVSVSCLFPDGTVREIPAEEADWSYRHSMMSDKGLVVLGATLQLASGNKDDIRAKMDDLAQRRSSKQPLEMASAGSTFKRPEGYFAGKLIQDSGMQGHSVGDAQVSTKHAGFVVNTGNASAADVLQVIRDVQAAVADQFGVTLETEVRMWGFAPTNN